MYIWIDPEVEFGAVFDGNLDGSVQGFALHIADGKPTVFVTLEHVTKATRFHFLTKDRVVAREEVQVHHRFC